MPGGLAAGHPLLPEILAENRRRRPPTGSSAAELRGNEGLGVLMDRFRKGV
jgi:hypothetical protein